MNEKRIAIHGTRILLVSIMACATMRASAVAATIEVSPPRPIGPGSATVLRPAVAADGPRDTPGDLLIHFHGAIDTIRAAMERAETTATVIVVNQPGLSAAYAKPFQEDPGLFDRLLAESAVSAGDDTAAPPRWRHVTLSCFSAGYGAVREILTTKQGFDRVDAIIAADSIYAGIDESADAGRQVNAHDMAGFLAFAEAAAAGRKVFVISHSAQPTPYASTTETADYLLGRLGVERTPIEPRPDKECSQVSQAGRGSFVVQGFTGASGPAHLFHLRSIDHWWKVAEGMSASAANSRSRLGDQDRP